MDEIITLLKNRIREGISLFVGAGFSMDAKDYSNRNLPSGQQLAEEIWPIAFPNESYDNVSKLGDIFLAAKKKSKNALTSLLKNRLRVDSTKIPEYYKNYFNFPWRTVYSLNIDNLGTKWEIDLMEDDVSIQYRQLQGLMRFLKG